MWQERASWCTSDSVSTNVHGVRVFMYTAILMCTGLVSISDGVIITQRSTDVLAKATDAVVTLPCNFSTNTFDIPLITWFRYRGTERRRIMQFRFNTLISYGELLNRVARGDSGALVLIRPTVVDSGKYSCEVEVDKENPNFAIADVTLAVTQPGIQVTIKEVRKPVTAKDSDSSVTLPCDFITDLPVTPRITWRLERGGGRKHIMTCDEGGALSVNEKFVDRVARGEKGGLVLMSPTVEDSGTYTCVVQVDDNSRVTSNVSLSVAGDIAITDSAYAGVVLLICVLWLIPVMCGFGLETGGIGKMKNIILQKIASKQHLTPSVLRDTECPTPEPDHPIPDTGRPKVEPDHPIPATGCPTQGKPGPEHPKLDTGCHTPQGVNERVGWRYIIIFLALCLIFSGTVCSAKALSSRGYTDFRHYQTAGCGTGIVGIVILFGIYVRGPLLRIYKNVTCRKTSIQKDPEKSGDEPMSVEGAPLVTNTENTTPSHNEDASNRTSQIVANPTGEQVAGLDDQPATDLNKAKMNPSLVEPSATSVYGKKIRQVSESENTTLESKGGARTPTFQILDNPAEGKVTGMVSTSYKDVYVTTASTVHHLYTPDFGCCNYTATIDVKSKKEVMMACGYNDGVILLTKSTRSKEYGVIACGFKTKKMYKHSKEWTMNCIFSEKDGNSIYITLPDTREIIRANVFKYKLERESTIDTCVLKCPTSVCKNSRGQLIVTDSARHDVFVFDESIGFVTSMKISMPNDMEHEFKGCDKLAIGSDDRIYVAGRNSKQVLVFGEDFRFERVIQTATQSRGVISCIMIHNNSLYVAHEDCIRIYPLDST